MSAYDPNRTFDDNESAAVATFLAKLLAILFDNLMVVNGVERFS